MPNSDALRVTQLFGKNVVDPDGCVVGRVHDVRVCRDGPSIPAFGPALRITGLIAGRGSFAGRLGLDRLDITGPWPLDAWGKRAAKRARFIPWEAVELEDDHIACKIHAAELASAYS